MWSRWQPYGTSLVLAFVASGVFLLDGATPTERGPLRDRYGTYEAAAEP